MDTITESGMAIALAREGGIGIIHRFMTIADQVDEVLRVKRSESVMIEQPYTVSQNMNVTDARKLMTDYGVSGLLVEDNDNKLLGIITRRDITFESNPTKKVSDSMSRDVITAQQGIAIEEAKEILHKHRIEKLPVVDTKYHIVGLITSKDILKMEQYPYASKDKKGRLLVGAAVGVKGDFLERTETLLEAGADVIVVDIAHGHSDNAINAVKMIKKAFPRSEEHTSELQSQSNLVCRLLLESCRSPTALHSFPTRRSSDLYASKDKKGRLLVGAAVGVKGDFLERTETLLEAGADVIVVDIAHGHSDNAINAVKMIKKAFP